jgi:hypothetical protein
VGVVSVGVGESGIEVGVGLVGVGVRVVGIAVGGARVEVGGTGVFVGVFGTGVDVFSGVFVGFVPLEGVGVLVGDFVGVRVGGRVSLAVGFLVTGVRVPDNFVSVTDFTSEALTVFFVSAWTAFICAVTLFSFIRLRSKTPLTKTVSMVNPLTVNTRALFSFMYSMSFVLAFPSAYSTSMGV